LLGARTAAGLFLALAMALAGCAAWDSPSSPRAADLAPSRAALPLEEAVLQLAMATLQVAELPPRPGGGPHPLVIDPLIDRATGTETAATRSMVRQIEALVRDRLPQYELRPFTLASLDAQPLILLGAITTVAGPGSLANATGPTDTWRIWAVLADLRGGRILSHPTAWVRAESVDATPVRFVRDSPVWVPDEARAAYLRTCAGNPGDPIDPAYLRMLRTQAAVAEATRAYEAGRPRAALALWRIAAEAPGGLEQQRVLNGLYLANAALGRQGEAEAAFARLVEFGLARDRLAVKLLFRPGSAEFPRDPAISGPYPMWLRQIATRADARAACLKVTGHSSVTGTPAVNDPLSLARARRVEARLVARAPRLDGRVRAEGLGARQPLIGLGTDDLRDALDRRVEFAPLACPGLTAEGGQASPAGG
jgi:outer membrane protein OmpA-like peptidoglycan-associated protein